MALTACRECDQQVSTEAATCPHCGVSHPATAESAPAEPLSAGRSGWYWFGIAAAAVAAGLVATFIGYRAWQSQEGIVVSGPALEQQIVDQYRDIAGNVNLTASCPSSPRLHKGKIVDCTVRRDDNDASSPVFITPTDDSGHFQMQLGDPRALLAPS